MTGTAPAPTSPSSSSLLGRLRPRWTTRAVVANLVAQVLIVVTGGAVRLTSSGLGCSTWPECEPGQFAPEFHAEMSIHAALEYGNRTLTGVLVVLALAVALLAGRDRARSRGYRLLAWAPLVGVAVQAVVGGITVLVELHPAVVGSHFLISMVLIAASAWLLVRTREGDGPPTPLVESRVRALARALVVLGVVVLVLGVVVTGAGPHSGDDEVGYRFAVDPYAMARWHALAVWAFVGALVAVLVLLARAPRTAAARPLRSGTALLVVTLAQGAVGYVQVLTGLPIALVNLHMLGAAGLTAMLATFLGTLRVRGGSPVTDVGGR
ncbi:COX15/CtaA family protein [Cellulomonas phragmiteti]|uniref:Protein required for cytochrome oxidase assembly n=1 Tax=Cellulomonas phragmiteti TaxID=478780 RepID=A0ABQ4DNR2_9CELL|nr:COX15/CtaA family protein [Cellulomonas phragmiteti]GIG40978.1 protein required for cytochrome oxidase assembly [Cellulomonas phragmiteti]